MASLIPGMRSTALRLSLGPSICRQCLQHQKPAAAARASGIVVQRVGLVVRRQFATTPRWRSATTTTTTTPQTTMPIPQGRSPMAALADKMASTAGGPVGSKTGSTSASSSSFPEKTTSGAVAYWLLGSAASVFGIVVFGGLTRLTESGLSITEWRPITGSLPPRSDADWESEFAKYRASPEFALLNSSMTLADFRQIYWMEWTHRLWGRLIGLTFALPAVYFVARRRVSARMALNLLGITGLIGVQGAIGWWMVKSGLRDDLFAPGSHPRVSQYRLAAHLGAAFACYAWMLLSALAVLRTRRLLRAPDPAAAAAALGSALANPALRRLRGAVGALTALIFVTAMSGALVAGLDAGLIYNEFPYMGLGLTPPKSELLSDFYSRKDDGSDLVWRNALENPSLVQLDHRALAMTTLTAVLALWAVSRRGALAKASPKDVKKGVLGLVHLVLMQVALGITTLIYIVPVPLAAAHQAGSLALLTGVLVLGHRLRVPASTIRAIERGLRMPAKGVAKVAKQTA